MASLQERNGSYRVLFPFRGKLQSFYHRPGETNDEADNKARQVDYLLNAAEAKARAAAAGHRH